MQSLSQRERESKIFVIQDELCNYGEAVVEELAKGFTGKPYSVVPPLIKCAEQILKRLEQVEIDYQEAHYESSLANQEKALF